MRTDRFRGTQNQEAIGIERIVKKRYHPLLEDRPQVNEKVAAGNKIQLGEGGISGDIVAGEYAGIADVFMNLEARVGLDEEAAQALRGNRLANACRINAVASNLQRRVADVGGEYLDGDAICLLAQEFHQGNG